MIRFFLRFIGLICLAAGFILLIYDGTKSIAGNRLFLTSVRTLWVSLGPGPDYDPGGTELGPARLFRHPFPRARSQEEAVDRLCAAITDN
jgi:hypothetical protein